MTSNANNLVWLDMEMTGLNPDGDHIIEMAMVVTNSELELGNRIAISVVIRAIKHWPAWMIGTRKRTGVRVDREGQGVDHR